MDLGKEARVQQGKVHMALVDEPAGPKIHGRGPGGSVRAAPCSWPWFMLPSSMVRNSFSLYCRSFQALCH